MTTATQTGMTTDEFLRRHGDESGVELVAGQIRRVPMPGCGDERSAEEGTDPHSPVLVVLRRVPGETVLDSCRRAVTHTLAGVRVVLVLDPERRCVGVFPSDELPYRLHNGDVLTLPDVLPDFAVPVARFFE